MPWQLQAFYMIKIAGSVPRIKKHPVGYDKCRKYKNMLRTDFDILIEIE